MIRRAIALTSFTAGYVLGARAGRERYEQIRATVLGVKNDPLVQELADEAAGLAKQHGSALTDKVTHTVTGHHTGTHVDGSVPTRTDPVGTEDWLRL